MAGENCTSGCLTHDHESWGDCVRAKGVRQQWLGGTGPSFSEQRRWAKDNETFRQGVRDGVPMAQIMRHGVDVAYRNAGKG